MGLSQRSHSTTYPRYHRSSRKLHTSWIEVDETLPEHITRRLRSGAATPLTRRIAEGPAGGRRGEDWSTATPISSKSESLRFFPYFLDPNSSPSCCFVSSTLRLRGNFGFRFRRGAGAFSCVDVVPTNFEAVVSQSCTVFIRPRPTD